MQEFLPLKNFPEQFTLESVKEVLFLDDMKLKVNVMRKPVEFYLLDIRCERITSFKDLNEALFQINNLNICKGAINVNDSDLITYTFAYKDSIGTWRHNKCLLLVADSQICPFCPNVKKSILQKRWRLEVQGNSKKIRLAMSLPQKKKISHLRGKVYQAEKAKKRLKYRLEQLKTELTKCQHDMSNVPLADVMDKLLKKMDIPENQRTLKLYQEIVQAQEILQAARNTKGRKCSEQWILLCLLMHMRSPSGYEFMQKNGILPLPCVHTVRRYLSMIDTPCGFDPKFFQLLELSLSQKKNSQKHGVILLNEKGVSSKKSVSVNSKTLTYDELVDLEADKRQSSEVQEKTNHDLIIMFQSLDDTYSQPVSVFASKGSVTGNVLAELIITVVSLLEKVGAKVHGVITDGATTNRRFWTAVGVSGRRDSLQNYFAHPTVEGRRVWVFSDAPHLIKTIRNRLYKSNLQITAGGELIKWEFLVALYKHDNCAFQRLCPKLTKSHVELNNWAKMNVSLAMQTFSKSTARGLRFYKQHFPTDFANCEATALFCEWINEMFDALNRKDYGIIPGDTDFKIIKESLQKLDAWEQLLDEGKISQDRFLTRQTAEGLRVTLKSTIDLVEYLIKQADFDFVCTGRLNQGGRLCVLKTVKT